MEEKTNHSMATMRIESSQGSSQQMRLWQGWMQHPMFQENILKRQTQGNDDEKENRYGM
jgi:hypothetical protein